MAGSSQPSMAIISGPSRLSQKGQHHLANDTIAVYPLTHSQEGIWIDYLADRTSTQYNLTVEWRLTYADKLPVSVQNIVAGMYFCRIVRYLRPNCLTNIAVQPSLSLQKDTLLYDLRSLCSVESHMFKSMAPMPPCLESVL